MQFLKDKILAEGKVLPGNILKVDNFLNHQIDVDLFLQLGQDFYEHFKDKNITRILTLEISGIAIAFAAATYFKVPVVYAKKTTSLTISDDVYLAKVKSYTKNTESDIRVDRRFIKPGDNVLIIDDFLAHGEALRGLISLCDQAGANVSAIGITIEKTFQNGGAAIKADGYDLYSQVRVKSLADNKVTFDEDL